MKDSIMILICVACILLALPVVALILTLAIVEMYEAVRALTWVLLILIGGGAVSGVSIRDEPKEAWE